MDEKIIWSIVFVAFVMLLCIIKPNIGRIFLGLFYITMALGVNLVNAFTNPQGTVEMGQNSLFDFYRLLFTNVVSKQPVLFILFIVAFELSMGLLILNKNKKVKIGLIGTILFLIFITPFGYIQIPWLGIALVQGYLLTKDFDETFISGLRKQFLKSKTG